MNIGDYIKKNIPKEPPGVDDWIHEWCRRMTYIIYNKKEGRAICTSCGCEFEAESYMKHNDVDSCPMCYHSAILKASGMGRGNLQDAFRIMICANRGKTMWVAVYEVRLDYKYFGQPGIQKYLRDVFTINGKEQHHYRKEFDWRDGGVIWKEAKTMKLPHVTGGSCSYYSPPPLENIFIFEGNIEKAFKKSDLKYLWDSEFVSGMTAYQLMRYMADGAKYQSIELLAKAGFRRIVYHRLDGYSGLSSVYWRGKSLEKILRLKRGDVKKLRRWNVTINELMAYQSLTQYERDNLTDYDVLIRLSKICRATAIARYTSLLKYAKYEAANEDVHEMSWLDYIEWAEGFDMDITDKRILFPKNFQQEHDRLMEEIEEEKNKELSEQINKQAEKIKSVSYETKDLIIKVAASQKMLTNESNQLGHCVRTYGKKVADGRCFIFFVREKAQLEKSYYTLETKPDGQFVQCRGKSNCDMTDEVRTFVTEFTKYLQKEIKKARKTA